MSIDKDLIEQIRKEFADVDCDVITIKITDDCVKIYNEDAKPHWTNSPFEMTIAEDNNDKDAIKGEVNILASSMIGCLDEMTKLFIKLRTSATLIRNLNE